MQWELDKGAGSVLSKLGIEWKQKLVTLSQIDVKSSRHNKARPTPIDADLVADYKDAMNEGDVFPMICVARINGSQKYVIAGGNHRHQAAVEIGQTEFPCIVFECDDFQYDIASKRLNLIVGQREKRDVRAQQAADMVFARGMTQSDAARENGVSSSCVSRVIAIRSVQESMVKFGCQANGLPEKTMAKLRRVKDDAVLLPIAVEVAKTKMNAVELAKAIEVAVTLPREADRKEYLSNVLNERRKITAGSRAVKRPARASISSAVTRLEASFKEGVTVCQTQMNADELQAIRQRLQIVVERIAQLTNG